MGGTVPSLSKSSSLFEASWGETRNHEESSKEWHYVYSTVVGFFRQDIARTDPGTLDALKENFGLTGQEYDTDKLLPDNGRNLTQWQRFAHKLRVMNRRAPNTVTYRLLYLGRHGQGYHNIGQMFYGDAAWDCYYCTFDQDPHVPTLTFLDAHLTRFGRHQAETASTFWQNLISTQKILLPQTYYSSPHIRAIQTAQLTFSALLLPPSQRFSPLVKEFLREGYGIQTCDLRPTKSYIQTNFPNFRVEDSFTEKDELYSPTRREPPQHFTQRLRALLDDIFAHDNSTYIRMTSHSGTIETMLQVIGHGKVSLPTGGIIPVLVKVRRASGKRHDDEDDAGWETKPDCKSDPLKAGKQGYKDIAEFLEEIDRACRNKREGWWIRGRHEWLSA